MHEIKFRKQIGYLAQARRQAARCQKILRSRKGASDAKQKQPEAQQIQRAPQAGMKATVAFKPATDIAGCCRSRPAEQALRCALAATADA